MLLKSFEFPILKNIEGEREEPHKLRKNVFTLIYDDEAKMIYFV